MGLAAFMMSPPYLRSVLHYTGHLTGGEGPADDASDNQVMSSTVGQILSLLGGDTSTADGVFFFKKG